MRPCGRAPARRSSKACRWSPPPARRACGGTRRARPGTAWPASRSPNPSDRRGTLGSMHSVVVGFGLGFLVALQLGPMSLFLIRSTLRGGVLTGLGVGAGIAAVDALYAAAGAAGAAPLLLIHPVRLVLGLIGAGVL